MPHATADHYYALERGCGDLVALLLDVVVACYGILCMGLLPTATVNNHNYAVARTRALTQALQRAQYCFLRETSDLGYHDEMLLRALVTGEVLPDGTSDGTLMQLESDLAAVERRARWIESQNIELAEDVVEEASDVLLQVYNLLASLLDL